MPLPLARQWQRRIHDHDTQAYGFPIEQVILRRL